METTENRIFIGRQAIYDQDGKVLGYELLSGTAESEQTPGAELILNAFLETGFEKIVGPHKAFVEMEADFLINMSPLPFDAETTVLMLSANTPITEPFSECMQNCLASHYQIALANYAFQPQWEELLEHIDYVQIDTENFEIANKPELRTLIDTNTALIAANINNAETQEQFEAMGCRYFQGIHFSRPGLIATKTLAENEVIVLQLLASLNDPDVTIESLDKLIQQDPVLSYKILRYINSAAIGLRTKVDSIKQAVVLIGLKRIKAWASVLAISGMKSTNQDLLVNAVVRAFMCQSLATRTSSINPDTAFTVGTLSILDVLMQTPMANVLEQLPLADEISSALLDRDGLLGQALECAIAYEQLDWENAAFEGCDSDCLNEIYLNSSHEGFRAVMGMEV